MRDVLRLLPHGVPGSKLDVEDNQLKAPFIIGAGQQLRLSPPRFHMVFPGDSSSSIAERYGISEEQLATANGSKVSCHEHSFWDVQGTYK